jgi:hypothetical protein
LFLVHLQLKVCVEWCVLGFGCGLGFVLVVAVVTSSANWKNLDVVILGLLLVQKSTPAPVPSGA